MPAGEGLLLVLEVEGDADAACLSDLVISDSSGQALDADVDELLHLAERVDPEVVDVIQKNPQAVPSFLRSAKDLTPEEWDKMQTYLNRMKKEKKPKAKKRGK